VGWDHDHAGVFNWHERGSAIDQVKAKRASVAVVQLSFVRLTRVIAILLLLSAGVAARTVSHSFVCKASGGLDGPIRFEFYRDSSTRPKNDIRSFTVSMRTADDRWKAMWSILSSHGLTRPIEYGVTPPGFTAMIKPQKLTPGNVYAASASDGHGSSSRVTFGFDKDGRMIFLDSFER